MDYDQLKNHLPEISGASRDRVVSRVARCVFEFPREWVNDGGSTPHGYRSTALLFLAKLIDDTAIEYLSSLHSLSPREFWKPFGETIAPFAVMAAMESGLLLDTEVTEFKAGLEQWLGVEPPRPLAGQIPLGRLAGDIINDRWQFWECQILNLRARASEAIEQAHAERQPSTPTPTPAPSIRAKAKSGPKVDLAERQRFCKIVQGVAPDGNWKGKEEDICEASDRAGISFPGPWRKKGCRSWSDQSDAELVRKAIGNRLKKVSK